MTNDYVVFAGDTLQLRVEVDDEAGAALDLAGVEFVYILHDRAGERMLRKTTSGEGITLDGNVATIAIAAGETAELGGATAYHELQATDSNGNVSTLLAGWVAFRRTEIAP